VFQEILLNFPVLPWTEVYRRHLCTIGDMWFQPASKAFWERTRALLALGATCKTMRQVVIVEAWKVYVVCSPRAGLRVDWSWPEALLSRYEILLKNPHLAANVRYGSLFVYPEYLDTSSDCSKDSGSGFRV